MAMKDFFQTHLFGRNLNQISCSFQNWRHIVGKIVIFITLCGLYYFLLLTKITIFFLVRCPYITKIRLYISWICSFVPYIGARKAKYIDNSSVYLVKTIVPKIDRVLVITTILTQVSLVQLVFTNENTVIIHKTEESDSMKLYHDGRLLSTLLISNHRSLNDYILMYYLVLFGSGFIKAEDSITDVMAKLWKIEGSELPVIEFISWGDIINFPTWIFWKNILFKGEDATISTKTVADHLLENGNKIMVMFPEVNILTTELCMIQRKLNQNYFPFVTKYYNVLYPRFSNFTNCINGFIQLHKKKLNNESTKCEESNQHKVRGAKILLPSSKMETTKEQDHNKDEMELNLESSNAKAFEETNGIILNTNIYDLTIIYYRPRLSQRGHDHEIGNLKSRTGLKLEQIVPSFFQMVKQNHSQRNVEPVVVMVNVKSQPLECLLEMKNKHMKRWLEAQWNRKEKLISTTDSKVRLK